MRAGVMAAVLGCLSSKMRVDMLLPMKAQLKAPLRECERVLLLVILWATLKVDELVS
jgi:hypothetical protein